VDDRCWPAIDENPFCGISGKTALIGQGIRVDAVIQLEFEIIVTYADDLVILCRKGKAEEALLGPTSVPTNESAPRSGSNRVPGGAASVKYSCVARCGGAG
jgi:hypothetical protein